MAPIKIEKIIISLNILKFKQNDKIINGAIFCQVIKIRLFIQFNPSITLGNQKWKGATPLFIIKEALNRIKINKKLNFSLNSIKKLNKIIENKRTHEAKAWVRKYFNRDSEVNKLLDFTDNGINESKLISKPIQTLIHEEEEILINVPLIKVIKNNNL